MARHAEPEIADLLEHGKTAKGNAVVNRRIRGELRPAVRESADPDVYCYALSKRFLSVRRSSLSTRPRTLWRTRRSPCFSAWGGYAGPVDSCRRSRRRRLGMEQAVRRRFMFV
ncbi:hypothetical protein T261_08967 [Streptomyces lydicus]|nr:hypothetical protein T261_0047 [Streptomyces lydicus]AQY20685.1 hypothetical protein T261_08967 [Streptomyces lydicus]